MIISPLSGWGSSKGRFHSHVDKTEIFCFPFCSMWLLFPLNATGERHGRIYNEITIYIPLTVTPSAKVYDN